MSNTKLTLDYYNSMANEFCQSTISADMGEFQSKFLKHIPDRGAILDLGCGSGRDSKAFLTTGYRVIAVDGSQELCKLASANIGQPVICSTFQEYTPTEKFDGIWACASLLHLDEEEMKNVILKLNQYLNSSGYWYISLKCENFEGIRNGRFFKSMTKDTFIEFIKQFPDLTLKELCISTDVRPGRENEQWINALLQKKL